MRQQGGDLSVSCRHTKNVDCFGWSVLYYLVLMSPLGIMSTDMQETCENNLNLCQNVHEEGVCLLAESCVHQ